MGISPYVRPVVAALMATLLTSCSHTGIQPNAASATTATSTIATNAAGRPKITYEPCKEIPATVVAQQKLDRRPPEPDRRTDGETENNTCGYLAQARYGVTVTASNYTFDMDKKDPAHWDFKDLEINGRKALSYYLFQGDTNTCAIDLQATTGVYGVMVDSATGKFGEFPDCLTAARAHLEAFLPHFPS
ncbi:DUF3558 domain-containing protein [Mycobacteroides abscessus]|uniref:DUF3558 domain-containing protein n=2 Tax=Mycobacteroides abscessus TaxID=36809 RepID=UPI000C25A517|nr:DUF3558 domain-containing protein [Mycobacteroides abscessus]PVA35734.1 DUF3558 domain-containing protein [Mycobacteroides abscessus]PVA52496.1 DUF3558 domain-containing protein [Mycobacteroides abscessus]RIQ86690.1 DUF3558 domain-containing protein [Mycobacteroides abscessus]RIQ96694.1 DUF3558 domain-containing protein [Mycobacteroides abscessus]